MATAVAPELAMSSRSSAVRVSYIEATERVTRDEDFASLKKSVAWLELFYMGALIWEFIHEEGIRSLDQLREQHVEVADHIRAAFPDAQLDPDIRELLPDLDGDRTQSSDAFTIEWSQAVRSFDAVVSECPIEGIKAISRKTDSP